MECKLFFRALPDMGPFPLGDLAVTKPAVLALQKSLKPGRYKNNLQWCITWRYSAAYGNIWSAGVLGLGSYTLNSSYRNMVVTTTTTIVTWFERFMKGNKMSMARIKRDTLGYQ